MARVLLFALAAFFYVNALAAPVDVRSADLGIGDIIDALGIGFVTQIHIVITLESFVTNFVSMDFDVKNPLPLEITIEKITSLAGVNGTEYTFLNHTFLEPGLIVPPNSTVNSGQIDNVLLTQGLLATLDIIPLEKLDIVDADAGIKVAILKDRLKIPISLNDLKQSGVPTTYDLSLS